MNRVLTAVINKIAHDLQHKNSDKSGVLVDIDDLIRMHLIMTSKECKYKQTNYLELEAFVLGLWTEQDLNVLKTVHNKVISWEFHRIKYCLLTMDWIGFVKHGLDL